VNELTPWPPLFRKERGKFKVKKFQMSGYKIENSGLIAKKLTPRPPLF
jgi:hypothetical protein